MAPAIKPYPTRSAENTKISRRTQQMQHNLTLRLSYARFKVENGWSALTLDEVENLWSRPFRVQQQQRDAETKAMRDSLAEQQGEEEAEDGVRRDPNEVDEEALLAGMELEWIAQSQEQEGAAAAGVGGGDGTRATPQPSATALGKRKAIDELLPPIPSLGTSSRSSSAAPVKLESVYSHLDKLPNVAPAARLNTHSTTPSSRFSTSNQSNQSGGGTATLPSSYEDFWTKLGSPSTVSLSLSAGGAGSTTTATSSNHSGPPSSPSTARSPTNPIQRSPINRKRSPFRPAVILPPNPANANTSRQSSTTNSTNTGTRLSRNLGGGGGMPLGSQASFSSLPPLPPLPFPSQSQQDQQQRDRSHSSEVDDDDDPPIPLSTTTTNIGSGQRGRQQTRGVATTVATTTTAGEEEGTSQDPQEELTMEAIDAAF